MRNIKTIFLASLLLACNFTTFGQKKTSSTLSSGDIFKFYIENTGIYKLDFALLSAIPELDITNINPKNINIYGSNGGVVPQILAENRIDDLEAIPIFISGEEDGSFDSGDYIILFFEGADKYHIDGSKILFDKNIYSRKNYFYLKIENNPSVRVTQQNSIQFPEFVNSTSERVLRHENDRLNLLGSFGGTQGSGKIWFGESFANEPIQNFSQSFTAPNLVLGSTAELEIKFAGRSNQSTRYDIDVDGQKYSRSISGTSLGNIEAVYAKIGTINENVVLSSPNPNVSVTFNKSDNTSEGWLDYIQLIIRENLKYNGIPTFVFDRESRNFNSYGFQLSTNENIKVWDITELTDIHEIIVDNNSQKPVFGFSTNDKVRNFILFKDNDIKSSPTFVGKVANQNLHSISRADLVIIYHSDFKEAAEKLADHRTQHDGMVVVTADVEHIYNEFGGQNDPSALRDFAKMIYDRDPQFRYLLLLGDGSYDYRDLVPDLDYQNFVPTYETNESLHPVEAFPSDDFFALLSDNEGGDSLDGALDIGVGRITVKTAAEANGVIQKIIHYDTNPRTLGEWRTKIGFTADDEDSNTHLRQADGIAQVVESSNPEMNQQKIYFDAFNQEATPGGARYPDANAALISNLLNGQLVLNYLGHGGPKGWAQERVFQINDIINLKNFDRLPILITATCSFTGFDEPTFVSAGEQSLLNPSGGAIALFSTVRAVYSSQNERITKEVFRTIFQRDNGAPLRFGDILRQSQNANSSDTLSSNTRKFMLFGDPSQRIALPRYNITVNQINDNDIIPGQVDTVGALGRMKLKGQIDDFNGNLLSNFNGQIFLTVYDKSSSLRTLDNDKEGKIFDFRLRKNVLYKGSASVVNGIFDMSYVLPKDINFEYGKGSLSFYASDGNVNDAIGQYGEVVIGGTSANGIADNEGPEIEIFFDERSFVFGGQTGANPLLILDLSDESGINLSSTSIGHDITASLDLDTNNAFILNEFYQPTLDKVGSGSVEYQLNQLEPGMHKITVKAWDILNNSSEKVAEFMVVENEEGFIRNLYNYPNPFSTNTNFTFEHDLIGSNLDIIVNVYTISGKLVKTIQTQRFSSNSKINDVNWNGNDDFEGKLAKGIYFYKINIASPELNLRRESDFQKLVILN